jgi:hypothetical protein
MEPNPALLCSTTNCLQFLIAEKESAGCEESQLNGAKHIERIFLNFLLECAKDGKE